MTDITGSAARARDGVLARIVAAHRRSAQSARDRSPELSRAWSRALRHAAAPFRGLDLLPGTISVDEDTGLRQALDALPGHGLVGVLEDREGRRGLIAISHELVDALIEVQTTGRVEASALPPRPVTRIDEALSRDFLDLTLAAFARETDGIATRDWPERLTYGSGIGDRKQLNLLLPEHGYHLLCAEVSLGETARREGRIMLAVPLLSSGGAQSETPSEQPEEWRDGLAAALREATLTLEAVLCRSTRSVRDLQALAPGDLIAFDADDLTAVTLETPEGRKVMTGRLGQMNGCRALKVSGETVSAAPNAIPDGEAVTGGPAASPPPPDLPAPRPGASPAGPLPPAQPATSEADIAGDGTQAFDAEPVHASMPVSAPGDIPADMPTDMPADMPTDMPADMPGALTAPGPGPGMEPAPMPLDFEPRSAPFDPDLPDT